MMPLLEVKDLSVSFGVIKAVKGISFTINEGEIVTLIGANGAGKTTTMNAITGVVKSQSGDIVFNGSSITNSNPADIVKKGISMSPEGRQVFPQMTVRENLELGAYTVKDKEVTKNGIRNAYELFPILKERAFQQAGTLSGGEQQMLAVARALMVNPKLLLLDEPSLGLAPLIVQNIFNLILKIRDMGTTVLLVEQNARMALSISDRGYVLETGKIVLDGTGKELMNNPKVIDAYLGGLS
jgi:branched-chain amino acid transport system ATP-binding protein